MVNFCSECGTKLEGTDKFCPECGTANNGGSSGGQGTISVSQSVTSEISNGRGKWIAIFSGLALLFIVGVKSMWSSTSSGLSASALETSINARLEEKFGRSTVCHEFSAITFGNPAEFFDAYPEFGVGNPQNFHVVEVTAPFSDDARNKLSLIMGGLRKLGFVETDQGGNAVFQWRPARPLAPNYNVSLLNTKIDQYLDVETDRADFKHTYLCFAKPTVEQVTNWTEPSGNEQPSENYAAFRMKFVLKPPFDGVPQFNEILNDMNRDVGSTNFRAALVKMNDGWHVEDISMSLH